MPGTNPLPNPPVAWIDLKTGQPTQVFYQYMSRLDQQFSTAVLSTLTANNSVSLDETVNITGAFDLYMIDLVNLVPATNLDVPLLQYQVGGAFQTASYSSLLAGGWTAGFNATGHASDNAPSSGILLGPNGGANFNGIFNGGAGVSGIIWLHAPNGGNLKTTTGSVAWETSIGTINTASVGGIYLGSFSVVTGLRFKYAAGNIVSGKVRIYGLKTP